MFLVESAWLGFAHAWWWGVIIIGMDKNDLTIGVIISVVGSIIIINEDIEFEI